MPKPPKSMFLEIGMFSGFYVVASHTLDITKVPVSITDMHIQFRRGCTVAHEQFVDGFALSSLRTISVQGPTYVQVVGRLDSLSITCSCHGYTDITVLHVTEQLHRPAKCTQKRALAWDVQWEARGGNKTACLKGSVGRPGQADLHTASHKQGEILAVADS